MCALKKIMMNGLNSFATQPETIILFIQTLFIILIS